MTKSTRPKRFPLLVYRRYHEIHRGVSVLLMAVGIVLAISAALLRFIRPQAVSGDPSLLLWAGLVLLFFGLFRFLLTWAISRVAYVQCTPRNVKIQTPFTPVVFSYARITGTRPQNVGDVFPPQRQKGSRRAILEGLWGETVIVVDLKGYPQMSKRVLRLLMGPFLLTPRGAGFVFLVKDWMSLNRQLAMYQEQWRARAGARPGVN